MGKKWTKAQHAKFSATMKAKRNGMSKKYAPGFDITTSTILADLRDAEMADLPLLQRWNAEANMAFVALPFEKKAALLATLEKR